MVNGDASAGEYPATTETTNTTIALPTTKLTPTPKDHLRILVVNGDASAGEYPATTEAMNTTIAPTTKLTPTPTDQLRILVPSN